MRCIKRERERRYIVERTNGNRERGRLDLGGERRE